MSDCKVLEIYIFSNPDSGMSLKVSQTLTENLNCYKEIYLTLKQKLFSKQLTDFL